MPSVRANCEYIYQQIARHLAGQIQEGILRTGERLPSIRQLCARERISPSTAMQALALLESRGLIEARPKSGFYVRIRRIDTAPQPAPTRCKPEPANVSICEIVAEVLRHAGDPAMVPLGAALPAPHLLPNDKLSRCLAAATRQDPQCIGKYEIFPGQPALLRQLALRFAATGCPIATEETVITIGAIEALNLAIRAVARPGDIIAVESPCYFGILQILESLGLKVLTIPGTCEHGIDLELLATAVESHPIKAVVLVPSFNNPNGSCLSDAKRQKLLNLLDDHSIPLIEDDIYGDLHFGSERPRPIKALDTRGQVLYCGSFSKCLSPGLRIGWVAAGQYTERVRQLKFINTLTTPAINQLAIADYLKSGGMDRHLRKLRMAFHTQVAQTGEAILDAFPQGTALSQPQGGFFLWIQLPDGVDSLALHRLAARNGITIVPGQIFCPHASIRNRMRISCGHPFDHKIHQAIQTLAKLVRQLESEKLQPGVLQRIP